MTIIKQPLQLSVSRRTGFILVEVLVVLAIIGLLAGITALASIQVIGYQRNSNTENTIKILSGALQSQWKAVIDQASKESPPSAVQSELAGGDAALARVIWIKLRLTQEFPMAFSEVLGGDQMVFTFQQRYGVKPKPAYVSALQQMGVLSYIQIKQIPPVNQADESAVCLYMALQANRAGGALKTDSLPPGVVQDLPWYDQAISPQFDPSKLPHIRQFVDSWGYPLSFYRWPTGNADLDASNPASSGTSTLFRDPLDPKGLLTNVGWSSNPSPIPAFVGIQASPPFVPAPRPLFEYCCHPVTDNPTQLAANPKSVYMVPVIVSRGKNNQLGLAGLDMSLDGSADSDDNIYSYRLLRVGQRGD